MSEAEILELFKLNRARVEEGKGSPKILIGSINLDGINWHTLPLIRMGASVVTVTNNGENHGTPERLYCGPENAQDLWGWMPPKWKPDFFWDPQAEHGHFFPVGLGELPIPTLVTYSHPYFGQALLHMDAMFDCVIRPSQTMKWGNASLPWGAGWGTMDERIAMLGSGPKAERDVDVCCTLGVGAAGQESVRHAVIAEMKAIEERREDWNVVVTYGLEPKAYFDLLGRSKVAICVGAWGSCMTYRQLEIIAQETALVHVDETAYGSKATLSEFFPPHWYVRAEPENLERRIEIAIETGQEMGPVIRRLANRDYSYERQYERLFRLAATVKKKAKLSFHDWSRHAYAVNHLTGHQHFAEEHAWALTEEDQRSATEYVDRDWDVCLWSPKDPEQRYRWQTELALRERPPREIYREYARSSRSAAP